VTELELYKRMNKVDYDGCAGISWFFWKVFKRAPWAQHCLFDHDVPYYRGGTKRERWFADVEFLRCMTREATSSFGIFWALIRYSAVRVFGHPIWPHGARWGFGHKYSIKGMYRLERLIKEND